MKDIEKCENLVESFMVKTLSTTEKLNLKYIDDELSDNEFNSNYENCDTNSKLIDYMPNFKDILWSWTINEQSNNPFYI